MLQKQTQNSKLSSEELQKRSFERKLEKTASRLRASESLLPSSIMKNESQLIPNSVSTKAFEQGLTLHSLLCGTSKHSSQQNLAEQTLSNENLNGTTRIPFYRNINSNLISSTFPIPTTTSQKNKEMKRQERYEILFNESFDIDIHRQGKRQLIQSSKQHGESSAGSASSTPVKKMLGNGMTEFEANDEEETSTLVDEHEDSRPNSSRTLIAGMDQSVKEVRESFEYFSGAANEVVHNITLNESYIEGEDGEKLNMTNGSRKSLPVSTEAKSTQTSCAWDMNTSSNNNSLHFRGCKPKAAQKFRTPSMKLQHKNKLNETTDEMIQAESKVMIKKQTAILREKFVMKAQLIQLKTKYLSESEKKKLFQELIDEFDEAKRRIKAGLNGKNANLESLIMSSNKTHKLLLESTCLLAQSKQNQTDGKSTGKILHQNKNTRNNSRLEQLIFSNNKNKNEMAAQIVPHVPRLDLSQNEDEHFDNEQIALESESSQMSENIPHSDLGQENVVSDKSINFQVQNEEAIHGVSAPDSLLEQTPSNASRSSNSKKEDEPNLFVRQEDNEELEVISARSLVDTVSSAQRTSAEIESIPEEIFATDRSLNAPISIISSPISSKRSTSTLGRGMQSLPLDSPANKSSQRDNSSAYSEDKENSNTKEISKHESSLSSTQTESELKEDMDSNKTKEDSLNKSSHGSKGIEPSNPLDNSITEEISEDIGSFKPNEKSLQSILSSIRSNHSSISSSGRDSVGNRRNSASEAILRLRLMNGVPELRSPRESKSPPKTSMTPRERFMTKYPQNSVSREGSFSEEFSMRGELLDELPSASQLGNVLDLSCSPANAALPKKVSSTTSTAAVRNRAEKTSHILLDTNRLLVAQFAYDHLNNWPSQEAIMETDRAVIDAVMSMNTIGKQ